MDNKKHQNANVKFTCDPCAFKCCKKGDYQRHILTAKHKRINGIKEDTQNTSTVVDDDEEIKPEKFSCVCGKEYIYMSGLCKHKKKCSGATSSSVSSITSHHTETETANTEFMLKLIKDNQDFKTLILQQNKDFKEQTKMLIEMCGKEKTVINTVHNTNSNNNNKFNLNVFLNEKCKNAMNIVDFVNSMKIDFTDLENVGKYGFIDGISKLIIRELKCIDIYKRPIHCSDLKREILYVKDSNKWEKEKDTKDKITGAIKLVAHKNVMLIPNWSQKYPECSNSVSSKNRDLNRIVIAIGENSADNAPLIHSKIIKNLAKEIIINKF